MRRDDDDADDRPRRRRKKASKKSKVVLYIAGGVGAFLLIGVVTLIIVIVWATSGKNKVTTPAAYVSYDSPEDVFQVDLPQDWVLRSGGPQKNLYWASATKGSASIKVNESLVGSLIGDIAGSGMRDENNVSDDRLQVSTVHDFKKRIFEDEYASYKEEPAVTVNTGFGKARRTTFTARGDLGIKIKGYRVTALAAMTQITMVCICSPGDWDALEPAFSRAIQSLGPDRGGR